MKRGETYLPDGFGLSDSTYAWLREKHPTVHVGDTFAIFVDKALARGWRYRDWNAAFRCYVRNGKAYGGVEYRTLTKDEDPKWQPILHEGRKAGFREPHEMETPTSYRTALQLWRDTPQARRSNVIPLGGVLRKVGP